MIITILYETNMHASIACMSEYKNFSQKNRAKKAIIKKFRVQTYKNITMIGVIYGKKTESNVMFHVKHCATLAVKTFW